MAERLLFIAAEGDDEDGGPPFEGLDDRAIAGRLAPLAAAWLADHPPDDGVALSFDWLEKAGLQAVRWPAPFHRVEWRYKLADEACEDIWLVASFCVDPVDPDHAGVWGLTYDLGKPFDVPIPRAPATRGDLRRLCAALGSPLSAEGV